MSNKDKYYQLLGVAPGASPDELKIAFRKLALKYHPDKCSDPNATEKFQVCNKIYNIIINFTCSQFFLYFLKEF